MVSHGHILVAYPVLNILKLLVHPEYYFSVRRKNLGSYYLIQLVFPDGSDGHFLRYGCLLPDGKSGLIPRL